MTDVLDRLLLGAIANADWVRAALHSGPPDEVNEISASRQLIQFRDPEGRTLSNIDEVVFRDLPNETAMYLGLWFEPRMPRDGDGGGLLFAVELDEPVRVGSGGVIRFDAGDVVVRLAPVVGG